MDIEEGFTKIPAAPVGKVRRSLLEIGKPGADIHVLALTPKLLHDQRDQLLRYLKAGSSLRLLLTGGLSALTWNDAKDTMLMHFKYLQEFRESLQQIDCDHQFQVLEIDWTPSIGLLQIGGVEDQGISYVSIYTPDPKANRNAKTLLKLSAEECRDLFGHYASQFLSLWREGRPVVEDPLLRMQFLRRTGTSRFRDILRRIDDIEIGFVIALTEEFEQFLSVIGEYTVQYDDEYSNYTYHFSIECEKEGVPKQRKCIAVLIGTMGHTNAAQMVDRIVSKYSIRTVISIGIAGGLSGDVKALDVVFASQVNSYFENAKAIENMTQPNELAFALGGQATKTTHRFKNEAVNLRFANEEIWKSWRVACEQNLSTAVGDSSIPPAVRNKLHEVCRELFGDSFETMTQLEAANKHPRVRITPELHADDVHIASGPIVGAHVAFVKWIKARGDRKVLALEMEAGGVMTAAYWRAREVRTIAVRAISDLADEGKSVLEELFEGRLRKVSMQNATLLIKIMLANGMLYDPES